MSVGQAAGSQASDVDLLAADLLPDEGKREAGEVRAAADAPDHDIGERARELHLGQRLLADDGLVQEDVVEHASERVGRVLPPRSVLDRFGDRDAQAPGRVGVRLENRAAAWVSSDGLATTLAPQVSIIERRYGFWWYETLTM